MIPRNLDAEAANRIDNLSTRDGIAAARALPVKGWLTFEGKAGLRLARVSTRVWTWRYRYRSPVDARVRQVKLGNWPAISWEKAVARWDEASRACTDGTDPQLERRATRARARADHVAAEALTKRDKVTVVKVARTYLAEHIAKECRTAKARYDALRLFESRVIPTIGNKPAHKIDRADAADFLAKVKLEAPAVARLLRSRLGGAWDHAIARRLLPSDHVNPWRDALRGKLAAKSRDRFLDDAELASFLAKLPSLEDADARDALALTLMTAARSGEVVAMEWPAVDLERGTWTIGWSKTGLSRTIRLPRQAAAILAARRKGFDVPQTRLAAALREAKHLGLRPFTPHDLRRSARTGLSRIGVRDEIAEAALGHVQGGLRGLYNLHAYEREVGEALQKWCDHLDALRAPEVKPFHKSAAPRSAH